MRGDGTWTKEEAVEVVKYDWTLDIFVKAESIGPADRMNARSTRKSSIRWFPDVWAEELERGWKWDGEESIQSKSWIIVSLLLYALILKCLRDNQLTCQVGTWVLGHWGEKKSWGCKFVSSQQIANI